MNYWEQESRKAFDKVAEQYPVGPNTPTRINSEGKIVNMSREAMNARLKALTGVVRDTITGEHDAS